MPVEHVLKSRSVAEVCTAMPGTRNPRRDNVQDFSARVPRYLPSQCDEVAGPATRARREKNAKGHGGIFVNTVTLAAHAGDYLTGEDAVGMTTAQRCKANKR